MPISCSQSKNLMETCKPPSRRSVRVRTPCPAPPCPALAGGSTCITEQQRANSVQAPSLNSQKSRRRSRTGPAPRQRRTSSRPMVPPVCVVALTGPAVVSIALAEAVVEEAPIVAVVAFEAAEEGLPLDLVRLLDQSRRTSPLHGTQTPLQKSPTTPSTTRRLRTRPKRLQRSSSLSSRPQRRLGPACSRRPSPRLQCPNRPRSLPPLSHPKCLRKYPTDRRRMMFLKSQLCRPMKNPYPLPLQTRSSKRRHPPRTTRPRRRQTNPSRWLRPISI